MSFIRPAWLNIFIKVATQSHMLDTEILLADSIGNNRRKKTQTLQPGFESDSDDFHDSDSEGESPPKPQKDEDDMFASEDEDTKPKGFDIDHFEKEQGLGKYDNEGAKQTNVINKPVEILDEAEIQDQHDYYNDIESFDGSAPRQKQDLQLEAFDLREEAESGTFDKDLNYTRREGDSEEDEEEDWMSVKGSEIKKAKDAQQMRESKATSKTTRSLQILLLSLIHLLEPAETPMEALGRLNPRSKKNKSDDPAEIKRKKIVYELSGLCDELLNDQGMGQIYEASREELMRAYKRETGHDYVAIITEEETKGKKRTLEEMDPETEDGERTKIENYGEPIWEFKWEGEDSINGPYSSYEMNYWVDSYFENRVEVRRLGEDTFRHVSEVTFED